MTLPRIKKLHTFCNTFPIITDKNYESIKIMISYDQKNLLSIIKKGYSLEKYRY